MEVGLVIVIGTVNKASELDFAKTGSESLD